LIPTGRTILPQVRLISSIKDIKQLSDIDSIIRTYDLDGPVYVQYFNWLKQIFSGNFGWSTTVSRSVLDAFKFFFPNTLELALFSAPVVILVGIWLGSVSAVHRDKPVEHFTRMLDCRLVSSNLLVWPHPPYDFLWIFPGPVSSRSSWL
jgi:peptide/nickel transport system permease protein